MYLCARVELGVPLQYAVVPPAAPRALRIVYRTRKEVVIGWQRPLVEAVVPLSYTVRVAFLDLSSYSSFNAPKTGSKSPRSGGRGGVAGTVPVEVGVLCSHWCRARIHRLAAMKRAHRGSLVV